MDGNTLVEINDIDQGLYIDAPGNENAHIFYPGAEEIMPSLEIMGHRRGITKRKSLGKIRKVRQ